MTGICCALLAVLQGQALEVTAAVDRARVPVGEEVTLTIQVRAQGVDAPRFDLPPLSGFAVVGTRDAAEVALEGAAGTSRTALRALTLRAERPGRLTIGSVRVHVGDAVATTAPFTIIVDSAASFPASALSAVARALLAAAPPPGRGDQVALSIVAPAAPAIVGHQLDVVLAAWFPRSLRERLRRPPLLTLLTPENVWSYPPATPGGVVLSRQVRGQPMDLYAVHQILFPLSAGTITIPPGSVEYAVPVNFSFFSSEERYSLATDSVNVAVQPLPEEGRAAADEGVVAESLRLSIDVDPPVGRVGEPLEVAATLSGGGNVALWPPPALRWPGGFRAYPEETTVRLESLGGHVGGSKTFRFLVMPDSAGVFLLPEVRYPYYDSSVKRYQVATLAARSFVASQGREPRAARATPQLLAPGGYDWSDALKAGLWPFGWIAILLLPPVGLYLRLRPRAPPPRAAEPEVHEPGELAALERAFGILVQAHVADAYSRDGASLARALRAAGVERTLAEHVGRLRERVRGIRYGPRSSGDPRELAAELRQVLKSLAHDTRGRRRRLSVGLGVVLLVLLGGARGLRAQGTSAEALYQAGALSAAADSFAERAAHDTLDPAHWYDLGATLYRSGDDGKAVAAWVMAERLAPRDGAIRRARALLPAPDAASASLLEVGYLTPGEWWIVAAALWIVCWGVLIVSRGTQRIAGASFGTLALTAAVLGAFEQRHDDRQLVVIASPRTPVRAAPYGPSSASLVLEPGAAAEVVDTFAGGRWLRIRRGDGVNGWVLASQVVRL
ncbi:MAG TPA: BatD family protein [Gemmatimonadales bacterium]|nr:BatD family protein [Gemmatimonadales bacterium]